MRRLIAWGLAAGLLAGCAEPVVRPHAGPPAVAPGAVAELPGWNTAQAAAALPALLRGCARLALTPPDQVLGGGGAVARLGGRAGQWNGVCAAARIVAPANPAAARAFFEMHFGVVALAASQPLTGYFEPEIVGSREKSRRYATPVLTRPMDLAEQIDGAGRRRFGRLEGGVLAPYFSRAEIDAGALRRQRLDLLYLAGPVDLFVLQSEGAGRILLPHGHVARVGYDSNNGQVSVPIGRVLAERGDLPAASVSAPSVRAWLEAHPREAVATLEQNPAFSFFREQKGLALDLGPLGALGVQLTPGVSVAVDRAAVPLGAPIWVAGRGLMVAQDLGGAGVDVFCGWGAEAERTAGGIGGTTQAFVLVPK